MMEPPANEHEKPGFDSDELYHDVLPAAEEDSAQPASGEPEETPDEGPARLDIQAEIAKMRQEVFRLQRSVKAMQMPSTEVLNFGEFKEDMEELTRLVSDRLLGQQKKWRRDAVEELITIVDAFDRLFNNIDEEEVGSSTYQGLVGIKNLLLDRLQKWGAEPIDVGEFFDPETQRAVAREEHGEYPDQAVLNVTRGGFRFEGSVLRPVEVVVNRNPDDGGSV